jgi:acyl-CoA hydrolase
MALEAVAAMVSSDAAQPRVAVSGNAAVPWQLLRAVDAALPAYRLFMLNAPLGIPAREGVVHETPFVGVGMRRSPSLAYVPARLSQVPELFGTTCPPDVVLLHTSAEHGGRVSMGAEVNVLPAAIEACRALAGSFSRRPTRGCRTRSVTVSSRSTSSTGSWRRMNRWGSTRGRYTGRAATRIGELVAERVVDGSTLQLGIGDVPNATLPGLSHRRGLRVWSEMVSDGLLALDAAGALDPDSEVVASFVVGSEGLYRHLDRNPRVRILRTEITNDPGRIAANPRMTSINTALSVDLFAQANASRIKARIHSGFGGQTDFIVGALHSSGGQALMALRSWHPRADVSTIVPLLDEPVTSFQHTAVVTEQGAAEIHGHDERTQARHLIDHAAHPSVRDELREEAVALGLA